MLFNTITTVAGFYTFIEQLVNNESYLLFFCRYSDLLTHHPVPVLAVILVLVTSCTVLNVLVGKPPDFSDPLQVN